jgi:hypothetical protein
MAASEKAIDSLLWAQQYVKNMPIYRVQMEVLNDAAKYFWRAAQWQWTLGELPSVQIINATQDYTVTLPADFDYGISAELTTTDDKTPRTLEIVPFIALAGQKQGQPNQLAISGELTTGNYRLNPSPNGYGSPLPFISGVYKKVFTPMTETTIYTAGSLVFPDMCIDVYRLIVLYYAYKYSDDQRAGNVQFANGGMTYTGQRAEMEAGIEDLRKRLILPLDVVETASNPKKKT